MRLRSIIPVILPIALGGALAATPAQAQIAERGDEPAEAARVPETDAGATAEILGEWGFEASPTRPGCDFTGDVTITQSPTPGVYQCAMQARDYCPDIWDFHAKQTCVATRDGASLTIRSTIDSVEPSTGAYWPDNFNLTIIDSANMTGELDSAIITEARFFRRLGPIS